MNDSQKHLEHLAEMRSLMERSTRFLSLSGLSGVWAGCCALVGAYYVNNHMKAAFLLSEYQDIYFDPNEPQATAFDLVKTALIVLIVALAGGWFFTARKARMRGERVWDASSRRLLWALMVPLATGGVFCLALLYWNHIIFLAPATQIFYGLALVNGSKYTLGDVGKLGILQIVLGLLGMFFPGSGLEHWAFGFGVLHIMYGGWMYYKYDKV